MRRPLPLSAALALALLACGRSGTAPPLPRPPDPPDPPAGPPPASGPEPRTAWPLGRAAGYRNPIPGENALPGDAGWADGRPGAGRLEAYADRVSARAGESIRVMARSDVAAPVRWTLYRLGWYGGAGARQVAAGGPATIGPQPSCPPAAGTGLVRCAWPAAFTIPVEDALLSGVYVVKLLRDDGVVAFAPLVVVDDRPADLLFQGAVNTWQAYNAWGGTSLYDDPLGVVSGGLPPLVSFDRPYGSAGGLGPVGDYEVPFLRFLERNGYDVSYTTDLDVSLGGWRHVLRAGALLVPGHDEYWTGEIRDALEAVRDAGMPVLVFSANAGYWKIRYDDAAQAPTSPRVIACYKNTEFDPGADRCPARTGPAASAIRPSIGPRARSWVPPTSPGSSSRSRWSSPTDPTGCSRAPGSGRATRSRS